MRACPQSDTKARHVMPNAKQHLIAGLAVGAVVNSAIQWLDRVDDPTKPVRLGRVVRLLNRCRGGGTAAGHPRTSRRPGSSEVLSQPHRRRPGRARDVGKTHGQLLRTGLPTSCSARHGVSQSHRPRLHDSRRNRPRISDQKQETHRTRPTDRVATSERGGSPVPRLNWRVLRLCLTNTS